MGWQLWASPGQLCRAELRAGGILAEVTGAVPQCGTVLPVGPHTAPLLPWAPGHTDPAGAPLWAWLPAEGGNLKPRVISPPAPLQEQSCWILTHCPSSGLSNSHVDMILLSSQLQRAKTLGKMTSSSPWKPTPFHDSEIWSSVRSYWRKLFSYT